jgi:hypothetical protein
MPAAGIHVLLGVSAVLNLAQRSSGTEATTSWLVASRRRLKRPKPNRNEEGIMSNYPKFESIGY